jgi:hypothetical protein
MCRLIFFATDIELCFRLEKGGEGVGQSSAAARSVVAADVV